MGITFDASDQTFHLQAGETSYILEIVRSKYVAHRYWGPRIRRYRHSNKLRFTDRSFSPNPDPSDRTFSLDTLPQEYPAYGNTDFRAPAYHVQLKNGSTITDLTYTGHRIIQGKPALAGLPATYVEADEEAQTLQLHLEDFLIGLQVELSYTVYETRNVITRSVRLTNGGSEAFKLLQALSFSVDLSRADLDFLHLSGTWAKERQMARRPLTMGTQSIESRRGTSSHQHNPFIALLAKGADEDHGEVYGFHLVYSGNFLAQAEVDAYGSTRVSMGIHPFDFSWLLEPGASFQTPEAVLVYSPRGLNDLSRTYHRLYRERLCRGRFRDQVRPILINNWEATYFAFDEEKLHQLAAAAQELGLELLVLDDGWFGKRDDDTSSLGDWVVDRRKLPAGLESLARGVQERGLQFGLWLEPEMVSVQSDLYRKHPDWCLHVPARPRSEGRNQLVLDLSRQEVCDYLIEAVSSILESAPITYVKWDMNRHLTEIGSPALPPERQRETAHRYVLGLYRVLETITARFPQILFESCSGGGGRFDPGMLYYMPQTWTSDNTDAVSRLFIQYGTSLVYPPITIGAHVSAVPNHQVYRSTSLAMRGHVAMSGNFGYELDLTALTSEEQAAVREQVALYRDIRPLIQFGDFYRLLSPFQGNEAAWMFVSADQSEAVLFYARILAEPSPPFRSLALKGLDPLGEYQWMETGTVYGGDELMAVGLNLPMQHGDFVSLLWRFRRVKTAS